MKQCCNHDCQQSDTCPARRPVEYRTGWPKLDHFLNAVAYGATLSFAMALVMILTWVVWGLS